MKRVLRILILTLVLASVMTFGSLQWQLENFFVASFVWFPEILLILVIIFGTRLVEKVIDLLMASLLGAVISVAFSLLCVSIVVNNPVYLRFIQYGLMKNSVFIALVYLALVSAGGSVAVMLRGKDGYWK